MVRLRIVEVDCSFDQTKAEQSGVEVDVLLRVPGNRGHMMNSVKLRHQKPAFVLRYGFV